MEKKTVEAENEKLEFDLFSEENGWGEWEPLFDERLGWLFYQVEDTAGSITLWITKEKITKPPMSYEDDPTKDENILAQVKLLFYGSFGNIDGEGCMYYNIDPTTNTYTDKIEYKNLKECDKVIDKWLVDFANKKGEKK